MRLNHRHDSLQCLDYTIQVLNPGRRRKSIFLIFFFLSFRHALNGHMLEDLMNLEFAIQPSKYGAHQFNKTVMKQYIAYQLSSSAIINV